MDVMWQEIVCFQVLSVAMSPVCVWGVHGARIPVITVFRNRLRRRRTEKQVKQHPLTLRVTTRPSTEKLGHTIRRVRRSWLSEYLDDLWAHVSHSFPRGALYAFPVIFVVMFLLCCATVLLD